MARKQKAVPVAVPSSREEAERLAEELAQTIRATERIKLDAADRMSAIKTELKCATEEGAARAKRLTLALSAWVIGHRQELMAGDRRSFQMGSGTAGFRLSPAKIEIDDEELTALALEELGRTDVLRLKTEIDKDALKADAELIGQLPGVRVTQTDRFFFKPLDVDNDVDVAIKLEVAA